MRPHGDPDRGAGRRPRRALAAAAAGVVLVAASCSDGGGEASSDTTAGAGGDDVEQALGPDDPASGESVRIGLVSDGQSAAFDARTEIYAAQATVDYWNAHRGGVGGRPIELVTCETGADPGAGTDCANQMVEDQVVAVAIGQSTVPDTIWEPLHQSGVPTMFFQTNGDRILADAESSFVISNPLTTAFGLPISVAQDEGADEVAFVVIDVPVAVNLFETLGPPIMENAGLDYEIVKVPLGTPDLTSQMSDIVDSGAGVVHVVGNDALCIAAIQGLAAVGYEGEVTAVSQCITDATRDALPGEQLEGTFVTSGVAVGAADDPTYQLYEAVVSAYGHDVDVENNVSMVGYTVTAALATSLDGITGDITPATVTEAIKAMPEAELPGGGGVRFRCGGSSMATNPALCSNQWLRATLDAHGEPASYDAVDSTDILEGL
jgi:branched-chain amino acid transport system substrate-binding protein